MKVLLSLILLLAACEPAQTPDPQNYPITKDRIHIHYIRDDRTGLCFAAQQIYGGIAFSNVPCASVGELLEP